MRKSTLFAAALLCGATVASAQTIGNPADPNNEGQYIVAYDLANGKWCDANPEIDETFVFAIDFTGTGLEDAMHSLPNPNRAGILGRGGAFDIYNDTNLNDDETAVAKADGRLFFIKDNIWGMTTNLYQLITSRLKDAAFGPNEDYTAYKVCTPGQAFTFNDNVFAYGWSATDPGAEWWDAIGAPVQGVLKWTMAAYTGTKTSPVFTYDDLGHETCPLEGLDNDAWVSMVGSWGGYGTPEDITNAAVVGSVKGITSNGQIVATEYYDLQGRRLSVAPQKGISICVQVMDNGSRKALKVVK